MEVRAKRGISDTFRLFGPNEVKTARAAPRGGHKSPPTEARFTIGFYSIYRFKAIYTFLILHRSMRSPAGYGPRFASL